MKNLLTIQIVRTMYETYENAVVSVHRVTPVTVEELLSTDSQDKVEKLSKAQLQILILCPNFAAKMADLKKNINCEELFKVDKILVMLLGVEKNQVVANNCEGNIIVKFLCYCVFSAR